MVVKESWRERERETDRQSVRKMREPGREVESGRERDSG